MSSTRRRSHDTQCYTCLDATNEPLLGCPQCTASVHRSCLAEYCLVKQYGSLEAAHGMGIIHMGQGLACPSGHSYFSDGESMTCHVQAHYRLRIPQWTHIVYGLRSLLMLVMFLSAYPTDHVPTIFGMVGLSITMPILFTWAPPLVFDDPYLVRRAAFCPTLATRKKVLSSAEGTCGMFKLPIESKNKPC